MIHEAAIDRSACHSDDDGSCVCDAVRAYVRARARSRDEGGRLLIDIRAPTVFVRLNARRAKTIGPRKINKLGRASDLNGESPTSRCRSRCPLEAGRRRATPEISSRECFPNPPTCRLATSTVSLRLFGFLYGHSECHRFHRSLASRTRFVVRRPTSGIQRSRMKWFRFPEMRNPVIRLVRQLDESPYTSSFYRESSVEMFFL